MGGIPPVDNKSTPDALNPNREKTPDMADKAVEEAHEEGEAAVDERPVLQPPLVPYASSTTEPEAASVETSEVDEDIDVDDRDTQSTATRIGQSTEIANVNVASDNNLAASVAKTASSTAAA